MHYYSVLEKSLLSAFVNALFVHMSFLTVLTDHRHHGSLGWPGKNHKWLGFFFNIVNIDPCYLCDTDAFHFIRSTVKLDWNFNEQKPETKWREVRKPGGQLRSPQTFDIITFGIIVTSLWLVLFHNFAMHSRTVLWNSCALHIIKRYQLPMAM